MLLACCGGLLAQNATLEDAWVLVKSGDRAGALRMAERVVQADPKNADARLLYGSLLSDAGNGQEALLQMSEAVKLRPKSAEAQNDLGEAYHRFGKADAARECFAKATALKADFGIAHLNLGQSLLEANDLRGAAAHLDRAIVLLGQTEDAADAQYLRAKVFNAKSDTQSAAVHLEKAVALRPAMAEAWSDLGQARRTLSDEKGALEAFQRAVQANPSDAVAQYRLGTQLLDADQLEPAIEHLSRASQLNATDQSTLNSLQLALRRAGRTEEAEAVRQKLAMQLRNRDKTDQNALNAVKMNNEGAELEKKGDLRAACEKYRAALGLDPEHVGIRVNYAVALLRLGQWRDGLDELREALRRDPDNAKIKAAFEDAQAQAPR